MKNMMLFLMGVVFMLNSVEAQNVGENAPGFSLEDIDGQNQKLSDYRGKVILVFLVGYNCSLCIASAPTVKSEILDAFGNNSKFQAMVIDTWDGSRSGVNSFKNTTGLDALYLQMGSNVASSWETTYDRLVVIDTEGKMIFNGSRAARSDADKAKAAVASALSITTSIEDLTDESYSLSQNYPNPVQNQTKIGFTVAEPSNIVISVFDLTGKEILTPVYGFHPQGSYEVVIQGSQLKSGIYFYRFEAENFTSIKKMVVQ